MIEKREDALGSLIDGLDDDGYNVPFDTFTWKRWQEMQAQMVQCFTRFQRAIEHKRPRNALAIAAEVQQMIVEWQEEAYELIRE